MEINNIIREPVEPQKIYDIFSEKHSTNGQIRDYGMVVMLYFEYNGREHEIGLSRSLREDIPKHGLDIMETVIEHLSSPVDTPRLYYWSIRMNRAHGNVIGHPRIDDSTHIHTSKIRSVEIDDEHGEAIITSENRIYHAELKYCDFGIQDEYASELPRYEELHEKYYKKSNEREYRNKAGGIFHEIEQGKVLLVLSDFDKYYFHSLCVRDNNGEIMDYSARPHLGMFQDSFLISTFGLGDTPYKEDDPDIDLRYFPHYKNIEFYSAETEGMPLYAENIGRSTLLIRLNKMTFSLGAGERKELCTANAESDIKGMPDGDLYPAEI